MAMRAFWNIDRIDPARTALLGPDGETSYGALRQRVDEMRARLDGRRGLIRIGTAPTVDSIAMYLAAVSQACPVILRDAKATAPQSALPLSYDYDPLSDQLKTYSPETETELHPDLRLLLSTSGSTGAQKFVRLSGDNLDSNATAIAEYLTLSQDDRAPTALPLSYSFGLSVLNSHLAVGASLLLIDEPVISETFWSRFRDAGCTSFSGVPQSFTLLAKGGQLDRDYPKLRYVTQAGGKLGPEAVRAMAQLGKSRGWDFFVMYGQTEAAPRIAYLPPEMAFERPDAIGLPIPGGILTIEGPEGPVSPGTEGELVFEGPNVMMGYASAPDDLAKGQGETRLKTGDLGYEAEDGLFVITGRASRFLKLSGKRVGLEEIEVWMAKTGIAGIATGGDDALGLVHTGSAPTLARDVAQFLDIPTSFVSAIETDVLPLNQNGKPDLKAARAIFDSHRTQAKPATTASGKDAETRATAMFRRQFPGVEITPETSFDKLGGTSADFVDVELALEEIGLDLPENWQTYSVGELATRPSAQGGTYVPDYGSARIICTFLVVFYHVVGINERNGLNLPNSSFWHAFNDFLDPLRMPMFAFLAGFSFWTMRTADTAPGQFAQTLLRQLLVPTIAAILAFAVVSTVISTPFAIRTPADALELLYLPYAHFWFIMSLTLILIGSYTLFRYAPVPLILVCGLAVLFLLFRVRVVPDVWAVSNAMILTPMFTLGYLYARNSAWVLERRVIIWGGAAIIVTAASLLLPDDPLAPLARRLVWVGLGLAMIALCLGLARHIPGLKFFAPYAFFIYLWHIFGTSGMRRAMDIAGVDEVSLRLIAGLLAGIFLPVLLYHVLAYIPGGRWIRGK